MRVVITRTWHVDGLAAAKLDAGQVFDVHGLTAIYLFAMHCAEPVSDTTLPTREPVAPEHQPIR
jgi:hypothetical protein